VRGELAVVDDEHGLAMAGIGVLEAVEHGQSDPNRGAGVRSADVFAQPGPRARRRRATSRRSGGANEGARRDGGERKRTRTKMNGKGLRHQKIHFAATMRTPSNS
jgi:hypothetical protein